MKEYMNIFSHLSMNKKVKDVSINTITHLNYSSSTLYWLKHVTVLYVVQHSQYYRCAYTYTYIQCYIWHISLPSCHCTVLFCNHHSHQWQTNLNMEDAMNVIIIILNMCEIVTNYTSSMEYGFQKARIHLHNVSSHSTADKLPAF